MMVIVVMQGMSQAFTVFSAPPPPSPPAREELRPTTAPPSASLETAETAETAETGETETAGQNEETRAASSTNTTIHFLEFPHKSYSYAVLEKKWSL